jgi:uncharacterized protein (TIGR02646 family)
MRAITKQGNGGYHLNQSHANPPAASDQATSRWGSFAHKEQVRQSLLDEQYQLCCYSELRADEEGLGYHIEHVENKDQNPTRTFDYTNLAASALDSANDLAAFAAQGDAVFGGHAAGKQQAVDMTRFVSCHQPNCPRFFSYVSDGRVVPARGLSPQDTDKANYTITLLNLNSPYLMTRRRKWWDELDQLFEEHQTKGWSLADLAAIDLVPHNQRLSRFFSLTRQFFGPIAESTLQQYAPGLV